MDTTKEEDRHMELIICIAIGITGAMIPYVLENDRANSLGE